MPWRFAVVGIAELVGGGRHQRGVLLRRQRCDAGTVERHQAGKESVQPGALLGRERRGFGNERRDRRRHVLAHAVTSASNICFSASIWWRLLKVRKVSSPS